MEFDEYEYLEKTVEAAAAAGQPNGGAGPEGKERRRSSAGDEGKEERDDRERRSKRSRSEHRDRDRESRERHRSSRERRDRDEKEREREKERRSREREKEKERERRSRSRSERRRGDDDDDRERHRERDYRDRDVRRRKEDGAEPEADPERDQRTVFAFQLSLKADERDVYEFFSRAGKVRDVRLIMDRNSRRSKGVGYIEFYDVMSVPMAIALSNQLLLGQPVMVKPSEAEKNLVQSSATSSVAASGGARKFNLRGCFSFLRRVLKSTLSVVSRQRSCFTTAIQKFLLHPRYKNQDDGKHTYDKDETCSIKARKVVKQIEIEGGCNGGSR